GNSGAEILKLPARRRSGPAGASVTNTGRTIELGKGEGTETGAEIGDLCPEFTGPLRCQSRVDLFTGIERKGVGDVDLRGIGAAVGLFRDFAEAFLGEVALEGGFGSDTVNLSAASAVLAPPVKDAPGRRSNCSVWSASGGFQPEPGRLDWTRHFSLIS